MGISNSLGINHWDTERVEYAKEHIHRLRGTMGKNVPIVSVGSGTGEYEYEITKDENESELELICVDTKDDEHLDSEYVIKPKYATVDDLIKDRSGIVGDCILCLFWSYDQGRMNDYPHSNYPYIDAIVKLKPKSIIILYEEFGGSGSDMLHYWLFGYDLPSNEDVFPKLDWLVVINEIPRYKCVSHKWHYGDHSPMHFSEKSIICAVFEPLD
jgi:hypothetical protein